MSASYTLKGYFRVIHYSLVCDKSHKFDGWFSNAAAYDSQQRRGLVTCPICLTTAVVRQIGQVIKPRCFWASYAAAFENQPSNL